MAVAGLSMSQSCSTNCTFGQTGTSVIPHHIQRCLFRRFVPCVTIFASRVLHDGVTLHFLPCGVNHPLIGPGVNVVGGAHRNLLGFGARPVLGPRGKGGVAAASAQSSVCICLRTSGSPRRIQLTGLRESAIHSASIVIAVPVAVARVDVARSPSIAHFRLGSNTGPSQSL